MAKTYGMFVVAGASLFAGVLAFSSAVSHRAASGEVTDTKDALTQNFAAEHEIGRRFHIDPNDLPAPKTGPIVTNRSLTLPYAGQAPQVPPGFTATLFASGLANPRRLLVLPNGDVLLAEQSAGYLTLLRDDGQGGPPPNGSIALPMISTSLTAWPCAATRCWSPTRTASGACRSFSAHCAPAARCRRSASPMCRPTSASRCPAPMAPRC